MNRYFTEHCLISNGSKYLQTTFKISIHFYLFYLLHMSTYNVFSGGSEKNIGMSCTTGCDVKSETIQSELKFSNLAFITHRLFLKTSRDPVMLTSG